MRAEVLDLSHLFQYTIKHYLACLGSRIRHCTAAAHHEELFTIYYYFLIVHQQVVEHDLYRYFMLFFCSLYQANALSSSCYCYYYIQGVIISHLVKRMPPYFHCQQLYYDDVFRFFFFVCEREKEKTRMDDSVMLQ